MSLNLSFIHPLTSRVHLGVILQMSRLTKRRSTDLALVRFLARMNPAMVPQRCVSRKSFVAHLTHVRLLTAVCPLVVLQMR